MLQLAHAHRLGRVTGGGSQLGPSRTIEYCGTEVEEYLPAYTEHRVWEDAES